MLSPKHKTRGSIKHPEPTITTVKNLDETDSDSDSTFEGSASSSASSLCAMSAANSPGDTHDDMDSRLRRIEKIVIGITPNIRSEIQKLKHSQKKKLDKIKASFTQFENDLAATKNENKMLAADNVILHDQLNSLEAHSRRNNLILRNVPEDQAPLKLTLCKILTNMGITKPEAIPFEAIHRIGRSTGAKPKPLIFCLTHRQDREMIWAAKRNLKGTHFSLDEDLPDAYAKARHALMPVMMAARSNNKKAMFVKDKIKVEGRLYGRGDIAKLPDHLNPEQSCVKQSDKTVLFFGRHTPFSNFYQCPIKVEGQTFNCVEQFLQKSKAEVMGDEETAVHIMSEADPARQKGLARNIKGDIQKWTSEANTITYKAIKAKFEQNPSLRQYLLASDQKELGEASQDPIWGIGSSLRNPHSLDCNTWTGKNLLGKLLMKARHELK